MTANTLSGYGLFVRSLVVLFSMGLLGAAPIPLAHQPNRIEIKFQSLPDKPAIPRPLSVASMVQMLVDDVHPEAAYGINDEATAFKFIGIDHFTAGPAYFLFLLKDNWVWFSYEDLEPGVYAGYQIGLLVHAGQDSNLDDFSVYLPLILLNAALPSTPSLYDIDNADGDGSYQLNWSTSSGATSYTLQEDDNIDLSSPEGIYSGAETSQAVTGKLPGSYYYRVRAENGTGFSPWSETKSALVNQPQQPICETHNFGTVGVSYQIQPSGYTEHFSAQNNMHIESLEVKSVLSADFPMYAHIYISVHGEQIASSNPWVYSIAYTAYTFNRNVSTELQEGDDITYYITKDVGDPSLSIRWGNYVMVCGTPTGSSGN
jgi:hypothetical protein